MLKHFEYILFLNVERHRNPATNWGRVGRTVNIVAPLAVAGFWRRWGYPILQHGRWRPANPLNLMRRAYMGQTFAWSHGGFDYTTRIVPRGLLLASGGDTTMWRFVGYVERPRVGHKEWITTTTCGAHKSVGAMPNHGSITVTS